MRRRDGWKSWHESSVKIPQQTALYFASTLNIPRKRVVPMSVKMVEEVSDAGSCRRFCRRWKRKFIAPLSCTRPPKKREPPPSATRSGCASNSKSARKKTKRMRRELVQLRKDREDIRAPGGKNVGPDGQPDPGAGGKLNDDGKHATAAIRPHGRVIRRGVTWPLRANNLRPTG